MNRALQIVEITQGSDHPNVATSLNNLGVLLYAKGDHAGAEQLYRRALEIREKTLGPDHPLTEGSLNKLAYALERKGDYVGAAQSYRQLLTILERTRGQDDITSVERIWITFRRSLHNDHNMAPTVRCRHAGVRPMVRCRIRHHRHLRRYLRWCLVRSALRLEEESRSRVTSLELRLLK